MKTPKNLGEVDLELLRLVYAQGGVARYDQPSDLKRAGDRCAAGGLLRCTREQSESYGKYIGTRMYTMWVYDPEYIAAHAAPDLLAQARVDMPYWGEPYPVVAKNFSAPRRGHLKIVDETFVPDPTPAWVGNEA